MSKKFFLPESLSEVDLEMNLEKLSDLYASNSTVVGKIKRLDTKNRYFIVELGGGITATMPVEEATMYPLYNPDNTYSVYITLLLFQTIQAKIIIFEENNIVLSRKANMLEILEILKDEKDNVWGVISGFSRLSAFLDIGGGIIGRSYSKNLCNTIFENTRDIGLQKGDLVSIKILNFSEKYGNFEVSRVDALPNFEDVLNVGDVVNCKVFTPLDDGIGHFVLIDSTFNGIVDSKEVELKYGDTIKALIKSITSKGPRLHFIEKVEKI